MREAILSNARASQMSIAVVSENVATLYIEILRFPKLILNCSRYREIGSVR